MSCFKHTHTHAHTHTNVDSLCLPQDKLSNPVTLETGDWYLTKHSNLSEVHVVFHLAVDGSVRSGDMSSRHPVILSIRNIIKLCFRYNIDTLTIPLLLTHDMAEVSHGGKDMFYLTYSTHCIYRYLDIREETRCYSHMIWQR